VSAIAESAVVVLAALVGVPEIDQRLRQRPAGAGEDPPAQLDQPRVAVRLDQIGALRRTWLEIRPLGLPDGGRIVVVALRRRHQWCCESVIEHEPRRGERARGEQPAACRINRHDALLAHAPLRF